MNDFWKERRVLVTGAGGFVGQHLVRRLQRLGARVRAFVRRDGSPAELDVDVVTGNLLDPGDCRRGAQGADTIFHLAGAGRRLGATHEEMLAIHVDATRHLLMAAREAGARRFVHASTVDVHGDLDVDCGDERTPFRAIDDYQLTKAEGDRLVSTFGAEIGLSCTIVRPSTVYGPGETRFLKLIRPIARGRFVMIGTGKNHVHFVYVDDLVDGFLRAGECESAAGEAFIIAGPRSCSLNELAKTVAAVLDVRPPGLRIPAWPVRQASVACERISRLIGVEPPLHPRRLGFFTRHRSYSIEKARRLLGYEPQTDLQSGLRMQIAWLREQGHM